MLLNPIILTSTTSITLLNHIHTTRLYKVSQILLIEVDFTCLIGNILLNIVNYTSLRVVHILWCFLIIYYVISHQLNMYLIMNGLKVGRGHYLVLNSLFSTVTYVSRKQPQSKPQLHQNLSRSKLSYILWVVCKAECTEAAFFFFEMRVSWPHRPIILYGHFLQSEACGLENGTTPIWLHPVTSVTPFSNGIPTHIQPSMSSDWRHPSVSIREFVHWVVEMGNLKILFQVMIWL